MLTDRDVYEAVTRYLDACDVTDSYDPDGITKDVIDAYGPVPIDSIPEDEWIEILIQNETDI